MTRSAQLRLEIVMTHAVQTAHISLATAITNAITAIALGSLYTAAAVRIV